MIPLPPPLSHLLEYYLITTQSYTKLSLPFAGAIAVALASAAVCCGRICRCFPSSSSKRRKKKQRHHPPISPPLFRILKIPTTQDQIFGTHTPSHGVCGWYRYKRRSKELEQHVAGLVRFSSSSSYIPPSYNTRYLLFFSFLV